MLMTLSYGGQIFCDFLGYSLMATGCARVLGFKLPDNFHMPYLANSVQDFWRRWHITLSTWLRDYLFIPLGGSRHGAVKTTIALMITMTLGGLWHGASWNFVLWGALHGIALIIHRGWQMIVPEKIIHRRFYKFCSWALTFIFVMLAWIPFRSPDFGTTLQFLMRLSGQGDGISWLNSPAIFCLITLFCWHTGSLLRPGMFSLQSLWHFPRAARPLIILIVMMAIALFAPLRTSPFIYFQF
jgi:alginate O-acetyltransferase complex protein AlgI